MPLFMVRWPNGDLSFVKARSRDDAVVLLDQVDDANGCPIKQITDEHEFMVHLALSDSGHLKLQSMGENLQSEVMEWAYPILAEAMVEGQAPPEAVEAERSRVNPHVTKPHPDLANIADVTKRISIAKHLRLADPASQLQTEK
jgi:hypothetical protein